MKIIEIRNVVKRFGDGVALNNVTVTFEEGKIHGLIGRNGSGKTVLLKCICGYIYPDEGGGYGKWKSNRKGYRYGSKCGSNHRVARISSKL